MRRGLSRLALPAVVLVGAAFLRAPRVDALDVITPARRLPGRVKAVRARDVNGDGRTDLVVVVERREADRLPATEVVVLRAPGDPDVASFFRDADVVRIPCSGEAAGGRARAGAVAIGRFGPKGEVRLRFLGPEATPDLLPDGTEAADSRSEPCLLERSPGEALAVWDAVGDVDGDGRDECFAPGPDGAVVAAGVSIPATETASRSDEAVFVRISRSARPTLADVDGDGRPEVLRVEGAALLVARTATGAAPARVDRVPLPFLAPDPARPPEQIRSPRLSIADVNGDGKADLLVTLIQGRADKVGGLRTSLYCFPGPFYDPATGALREPVSRLDTESVALHPRFADLDGDGDLDYVADSIRGNMLDLIKRVTGSEPSITFTAFRFDKAAGAYEKEPSCVVERPYSGPEARSNSFGRSAFSEGDFDGDGVKDLLDLGNLTKAVVLRGTKWEDSWKHPLVEGPVAPAGAAFASDAVIADLNGDGRSDAVLWVDDTLHLLVSRGAR